MILILATKIVSRCRRTLRGEGHSVAGWDRWDGLAADCRSKVRSLRQGAAVSCAVLPTANADQYATSHCKSLLFWLPCKWRYINVRTFNL